MNVHDTDWAKHYRDVRRRLEPAPHLVQPPTYVDESHRWSWLPQARQYERSSRRALAARLRERIVFFGESRLILPVTPVYFRGFYQRFTGLGEIALRSQARAAHLVWVRHVGYWAMVRIIGASQNRAAILFGRDHTSIRNAVMRLEVARESLGIEIDRDRPEETIAAMLFNGPMRPDKRPTTMMPFTKTSATKWFGEAMQTGLTDRTSFRHMITMVERERATVEKLIPDYQKAGLPDVVADCNADIAIADELLGKMRARLVEIENG